jgi:putative SOS response-associated peptidase YedK
MCNLYSITTNQAAIIALFRVINRYVGNLPPMPGMFPDYPAPIVRNVGADRELTDATITVDEKHSSGQSHLVVNYKKAAPTGTSRLLPLFPRTGRTRIWQS